MQKMKRFISIVLTVCMLMSILSMGVLAVTITEKPADGTTEGQPFAPGTGGSTYFRIPGIVTLDNGTLIAACDARWNHTGDGAGLDTIVSVSTDNGENWTYTFANYLGDNGDVYNNLSTCIIDPGIGTDGTTAYLIADLWPAGIALNTSKYSPVAGKTGYDANGNLALRDASKDTVTIGYSGYNTMAANAAYDYYLDLETLELCKNDGTVVEGYTVDAYFNITGNGVDTNLFFSDSPFQPYPTDYLYMTTSTDGLNWSEPTLLNLKEASEQTLLVGPGNGTYNPYTGHMIFTAYEHSSGYERACLIWMDAEGEWHRTADATGSANWSSEASSVVLEDGTVRTFYRDGFYVVRYTDYIWDEAQGNYVPDYDSYEVSTSAPKQQRNQLTSILYSQKIDGKEAIMVSCAATSGSRTDGHLYVFLVNEDKTMDLAYDYDIVPGEIETYAYNCLTELSDGNLGLLYESAAAGITYIVIDIDDVITRDNDPRLSVKEIELYEGFSEVINDTTGYYVDADISELDTTVATLTMTGEEVVTNAAMVLANSANIDLDSCQYTFTATEDGYYEVSALTAGGETVYLNHFSTTNNNVPNLTSPIGKIAVMEGTVENMFKLQAQIVAGGSGNPRTLHFHAEAGAPYWNRCGSDTSYKCQEYLFRKAESGETASTEIPGYVMLTGIDEFVEGQYLIAAKNDEGNWFVLNPSTSSDKFGHVAQIMGSTTVGHTELTFTGVGKGYTEVVVGSTIYKLTVHGANDIYLDVGESKVVVDETGYYVDADLSALDTSIATAELTGEVTGYEKVLSVDNVTEIEDGKTYVLYNKAANKLMNNNWADASVGGGGSDGLSLRSSKSGFQDDDCWTVTVTEGGYYVQDVDGKYLSISRGKGQVKDNPVVINLDFDGTDWTIGENGEYANDFGGAHSAVAGWSDINDVNSQWYIYEVSQVTLGTTTITFTGVGEGETSVQIGDEIYEITVTEPYVDPADDSRDIPLSVLEVSAGDWQTGYESSEGPANLAVDNDPNTIWHTDWYGTSRENHWFQFELTDYYSVDGLRYWPRQSGNSNGTITEYEIQVSDDGENWRTVASGEWENNRSWKLVKFDGEVVKYVRLVAVDAVTDNQYVFASASEIRITGVKTEAPEHTHSYTAVVTAPTCTEGGYTTYTCECGDTYVADETEATGHTAGEAVKENEVAPTCTAAGSYDSVVYCSVCNAELSRETVAVAALDHTAAEAVVENEVAPTCTEAGSYDSVVYCSVCNVEISRETVTVDALGHDYVAEFIEPTCTKSGYTLYTCSRCGHSFKDDPVEPEHKWDEGTVTAPTCTEMGYTTYTCTVCGEKYVDEASWVPAAGHDYVNGDCTKCDSVLKSSFEDVPAGSFFFDPVAWAVENGITTGTTPTTFNPNGTCQRAVVVTFLWRAAGSPEPTTTENPFTDVKEGDFFYKAVLWAVEKGITNGISATQFGPLVECNRAQVVTFLYRAMGKPAVTSAENPFTDVVATDWYGPAVLWAVEKGITNGMGDGTFGILNTCNRAQVVTFLYRTYVK